MSNMSGSFQFGLFELDPARQELRRRGVLLKLQAQPLKVLALLVERAGEVVSRQQIRHHIWGEETFVDFEQGITVCIRQIRHVLGDSAASPRFVETVPRQGYRFLAEVDHQPPPQADQQTPELVDAQVASMPRQSVWRPGAAVIVVLSMLVVGTLMAARSRPPATLESGVTSETDRRLDAGLLLVLPFTTLGDHRAEDHLGAGLTEDLITEISRRFGGRLGVIARTSATNLGRTSEGTPSHSLDSARRLGAGHVVEGSVRRQGDRVRITARLVRTDDEVHLWAGRYDRELVGLIDVAGEVSQKIGQALALELGLETTGEPAGSAATDPLAYEAFLQGRYELSRQRPNGSWPDGAIAAAGNHLRQALEIDAGFAPAWVELSKVLRFQAGPRQGPLQAREALDRALALDDTSARAHRRLAMLRFYSDWDIEGARVSFERALELDPGFAAVHHDIAAYYSVNGRHDEAVASVKRALRLDPLSPSVASDVGWYYYFGRRWSEAIEASRRTLELQPGFFWAKRCILQAAMAAGDFETAAEQGLQDMRELGAAPADVEAVASADAVSGVEAYWRWRLTHLSSGAEGAKRIRAIELADIHMALGEPEPALAALERAHKEHIGWILPFLRVHPLYDPLRSDPRFRRLVEKITPDPA